MNPIFKMTSRIVRSFAILLIIGMSSMAKGGEIDSLHQILTIELAEQSKSVLDFQNMQLEIGDLSDYGDSLNSSRSTLAKLTDEAARRLDKTRLITIRTSVAGFLGTLESHAWIQSIPQRGGETLLAFEKIVAEAADVESKSLGAFMQDWSAQLAKQIRIVEDEMKFMRGELQ